MTLDDLDRAVIRRLQVDGRLPYADIAAELDRPEHEIEECAERLLADGVIEILAVTDPIQLGYARQAMLGIEVDGPSQPVGLLLAEFDDVIYIARTDGKFQLLVEVVGASDARLLELVAQIRRIPGVRRIHTFLCTEVVKETYAFGTA